MISKLLVIAYREYSAMVATRAFLVTLFMMPLLMFGGMFLMPQLSKLGGGKTQRIVVADGTGKLFTALKIAAEARNAFLKAQVEKSSDDAKQGDPKNSEGGFRDREGGMAQAADYYELELAASPSLTDEQRLELSDQIRNGKLYAFVEIPADLVKLPELGIDMQVPKGTFVSQDSLLSGGRQWMSTVLAELVRAQRLQAIGLDPVVVAKATIPVELTPKPPTKAHQEKGAGDNANVLVTLFLPFGIMMLMFMVIFLAAQPMLESGFEEKNHRIAEVLLGAVSPTELMAGKLIGNVCGSLVIFAVYGIGGWLVLNQNDLAKEIPMALLPWFILFQLLGVLFFSSIFLTVGASISEMKEAQSLLMPIWLVMMMPMMIWFVALRDPNGPVATSLSMFPPSAPLMMTLRLASGQTIPMWQPFVSAFILLLATGCVILIAGRIYRVSLLRTDSARSLKQFFSRMW